MTKKQCIPKKTVATILNKSESTITRWAKSGIIPKPFQIGTNTTVWDVDEIYEWIEKKKQTRGFASPKSIRVKNVNKTQ